MSETVNHGFGETAERIRDLPVTVEKLM